MRACSSCLTRDDHVRLRVGSFSLHHDHDDDTNSFRNEFKGFSTFKLESEHDQHDDRRTLSRTSG
eukprot:2759055-Rhodomonas_salina.1